MSIELHIERLLIDEALLSGERPHEVCRALERELTQRLALPGVAKALRLHSVVAMLPPAMLPAASHPHERLGTRIAAAVGQGIGVGAQARQTAQPGHRVIGSR